MVATLGVMTCDPCLWGPRCSLVTGLSGKGTGVAEVE